MRAALLTCANCKFWMPLGGGTCHRFPPPLHLYAAQWPPTRAQDWCGEHQRFPQLPKEDAV